MTISVLPDPVDVLLVKLLRVYVSLGELAAEEADRVLQVQTDAFQEQTVLEGEEVYESVEHC